MRKVEYSLLRHTDEELKSYKLVAEHSDIGRNLKRLKRKYIRYIGKWVLLDDGYVAQILRIRYSSSSYGWDEKYVFEAYIPNGEDLVEVSIGDVESGKIEQISEKSAKEYLMGGGE